MAESNEFTFQKTRCFGVDLKVISILLDDFHKRTGIAPDSLTEDEVRFVLRVERTIRKQIICPT